MKRLGNRINDFLEKKFPSNVSEIYKEVFKCTSIYRDCFLGNISAKIKFNEAKRELPEELLKELSIKRKEAESLMNYQTIAWRLLLEKTRRKADLGCIAVIAEFHMKNNKDIQEYLTSRLIRDLARDNEKYGEIAEGEEDILYFECKYAMELVSFGFELKGYIPVLKEAAKQGKVDQEEAYLAIIKGKKRVGYI